MKKTFHCEKCGLELEPEEQFKRARKGAVICECGDWLAVPDCWFRSECDKSCEHFESCEKLSR